jgi:hypothetical protein
MKPRLLPAGHPVGATPKPFTIPPEHPNRTNAELQQLQCNHAGKKKAHYDFS